MSGGSLARLNRKLCDLAVGAESLDAPYKIPGTVSHHGYLTGQEHINRLKLQLFASGRGNFIFVHHIVHKLQSLGYLRAVYLRHTVIIYETSVILKNKVLPAMDSFLHLIKVGYSVFFEQLLMRIGFMLTAIMAAKQGTDAMAAHQVGMNIMALSFSFGDGLQAAAVALIGRSLGAGDEELAREYGCICRMFGGLISVCLAVIYFIGAAPLMRLFFAEEHIVAIGVSIMHVIIFVVMFQISQVVYMGCLRGAGDTFYTAAASTVSVTFIRTIGSLLGGYVFGLGIIGIWLGVLADQISRFLFASTRFKKGKWTEIKI